MECIRFHSDFFKEALTPEREITRTRKKCVSAIFQWGNHIWNFKTLACTFIRYDIYQKVSWTDTWMHGQPQTNMPPQLLRSWGHNKKNMMKHLIVHNQVNMVKRTQSIKNDYGNSEMVLYMPIGYYTVTSWPMKHYYSTFWRDFHKLQR